MTKKRLRPFGDVTRPRQATRRHTEWVLTSSSFTGPPVKCGGPNGGQSRARRPVHGPAEFYGLQPWIFLSLTVVQVGLSDLFGESRYDS
uniref:Uncharacterized protein n=1 Tax=Solanum tuberosum TaxID=4113 RepID=M1DB31_SOLTU